MAKILFAAFPATGHVNPGLSIARELVRLGHDVRWYSTPQFERAIERAGARFVPYKRPVAIDERRLPELFPERPESGLKQLQFDLAEIFVGLLPALYADLEEELLREPADLIVGDNAALVTQLVSEKLDIPFVSYGAVVMTSSSRDTAPFGLALLPSPTSLGRLRNRFLYWINDRVVFGKAFARYRGIRRDLGLPRYPRSPFDFTKDAALYLQGTVPSFEYPRTDMPENVRWIGPSIPQPPENWTAPSWWSELDRGPVVLVTQGTVANDYDQLIRPAIRAFANQDVKVVVTTGGKPADAVGFDAMPRNVFVEQFIPYAHLMSKVSVLVTNGGYGTVQIALAHGVPVVAFGKTEEKPEVANRVSSFGVGVGLKVLVPTEDQIRDAVTRVLSDPQFRRRAEQIGKDMAGLDAAAVAARVIEELLSTDALDRQHDDLHRLPALLVDLDREPARPGVHEIPLRDGLTGSIQE